MGTVAAVTCCGGKENQTTHDEENIQPIRETPHVVVDLGLPCDQTLVINEPAEFTHQEASSKSEFPIQVWMKTNFNINAKHGGGVGLLLISGKSTELNFENIWSELFIIRCGFDGNHFEATSLAKGAQHSVDHHMEINTDAKGDLCPAALCGDGHCCVISNIAQMGNCACAVIFEEGADDASSSTSGASRLGLKAISGSAGGCFIVLCSATSKQGRSPSNIYFVHQGDSDEDLTAKALTTGIADQWQFKSSDNGDVDVRGPRRSHYSVVSNLSKQMLSQNADEKLGKVYHTDTFDGSSTTTLLTSCTGHEGRTLLLMCSCSSGTENDTTSGLYQVTIQDKTVESCYLGGSSGNMDSPSLWNVEVTPDKRLVVTGPPSPCRYGYISNIPEDIVDYKKRYQTVCLATGKDSPVHGSFQLRNNTLIGWVSRSVPVKIWLNESVIETVEVAQLLQQPDGRMGFRRELNPGENGPGLKLFRAFAVVEHINKETVDIELTGSPVQQECQPEGVQFAVNLGGPAYESKNNVVYADTQTMFKLHPIEGYKCTRVYTHYVPRDTNLYSLVSGTDDGFLCGTCNETRHYYQNARGMYFDIDLPNGEYCLRIHTVGGGLEDQHVDINGVSHSKEVLTKISNIPDVIQGLTAKVVTIPFTVDAGKVNIHFGTNLTKFLRCFPGAMAGTTVNPEDIDPEDDDEDIDASSVNIPSARVCAMMIYDPAIYSEPVISEQDLKNETLESQTLADKLIPMERNLQTKEFKIAGWSSNLLENASGEAGDLSHWNVSGSWETSAEGGDQTETRFISSFMTCSKYQEVDLTRFFSEEYLDTSPKIQASESFHEGPNNGGYYSLTVSLLSFDGEVIEKKSTGTIGSITTPDWIKESFTFKDYPKGVRLVGFESTGRDDKYWAGHFGAWASAAMVRVKSDSKPAENDASSDVVEENLSTEKIQELSRMIGKLNDEYSEGLKHMMGNDDTKDISMSGQPENASTKGSSASVTTTQRPKKRKNKKREIRIFVSSTFVDFKDEREILIKKAFREVNRICLDRGVFFTYVDLRWGITSDQSKDGKTISICLREVDKCRPYFICLLGDRFGWSQTETKKDELLDKSYNFAIKSVQGFEWLEDFRHNTSVTKLEILHGALRAKDTEINRKFFYLRDSKVHRNMLPKPEDKKPGESQWHYDQQHALRESIKKSGLTYREFSTAEDGCTKIKEDLIRCVNEDFPPGSQLSHNDREKEAHEAFASVRKRVYIGREDYFKAIDQHFDQTTEGSNQPLVILGQSGSGKLALVANWCGRYEEKNLEDFIFMHFIGSSPESASHWNLLRRLYEELRIFLHQEDLAIPTSDRNLVLELPAWLKLASNSGHRVMLVLDALNQLDSGAGSSGEEQDLKWLPKELPRNVHLLMSTLPGRARDAVEQTGWSTMEVYPLNPQEKLDIVSGYMSLYAKTLNKEQTSLIIEAEQSNNPLYLKALLDEVRMYGSFEQLTSAIRSYLTADDPGKLFVKILGRLEADFDQGNVSRPGLVRDTTVAIWCSRRGISEQELIDLLKVPSHVWSPFYLSLEENLVNRNGIVNFFHDYMRQAVEHKYLPSTEEKQEGYRTLSDFFRKRDIDDRYVDEVPFLLAQAGDLKGLRAAVLNISVFQRLMNTEEGKYQLIRSWHILGGYVQVEKAYLAVLQSSTVQVVGAKAGADLTRAMAGFFMQLGLLKGARYLLEKLLKELESYHFETHRIIVYHHANYSRKIRCNHPDVIDVLIETGIVSCKLGLLDEANDVLHDALSRQPRPRSPSQKLQLVRTMMEMGSVKRLQKNPDEAKRFLIRAQELATEILGSNHHYVSAIIGQVGELSYGQGKLEDAILHHLKDLKLTQREVGLNHPRVAAILNNIALVLDDLNNKISGDLFQVVLAILVSAYGKDHVDVAIVRYNLGAFFLANNYFQRAGFQLREAERIFRGFLGDEHPHTMATIAAINRL